MGTNCAPLVADLFLFCYERGFIMSFSAEYQVDITGPFNSTSRYPDNLLNVDNIYFEQMVNRIYPAELQFPGSVFRWQLICVKETITKYLRSLRAKKFVK